MINLIPNAEKKKKVQDFYFRLAVVFCYIIGFSLLIASVAILPAYSLSSVKKKVLNEKLLAQKNEPVPEFDQEILSRVAELKKELNLINQGKQNISPVSTKVINQILLHKMSDIKVTKILYNGSLPENKKISIEGTAISRERLLLFRKALEDDTNFKNVDLPISNFIRGSDLRFSISLVPV